MCDGGVARAAPPMKSFLNVIGMLALLGGILALLMAASAVHEILAGISILVCVTSLGLAKLIDLADTHLERTSEQRRKEREHWEAALGAARAPAASSLPPLPGTEKWHVEVRGQIQGPLGIHEIRALRDKGVIDGDAFVFCEGWTQWLRLRETKELG